ncbi:BEN domain-containing protein 5-like [Micropterus dolomieu]|uniref:BEN domain-containing protein 5-like n=1 Tax=Micropterus dolomieu TaxID=147949 RepID=UPI001E8EC581|nr:BEN domain-containing protein 5-like [Micropterus dolomieu]
MFAYVKYTGGYKAIVPISYIKNFDLKTRQRDVWEDEYFNGQVLLVKETRDEIEELTVNPPKRIRVPKIHLEDGVAVEKHEGTSREKDGLKKKAKTSKAAEGSEKRKSLMQILAEKKAMKKHSPLFANDKKRKREETLQDIFSDSEEDGGVVPQKIHDELRLKYQQMQRKQQDLKQDLDHYKQKSAELENCKCELEQELTTYRNSNLTLQQNLDELLKQVFSQKSVTSQHCVIAPLTPPAINNPTSERDPLQPTPCPNLLEKKDGMIHIGKDMWLREEVWRKIHSTTKDSLFVKELAVPIWGTLELRGRSVSGKECPTKNTEAKPPLSPYKLGIWNPQRALQWMVEGTEHGEDREGEEGEACGILHFTKNSRPCEKRKKTL